MCTVTLFQQSEYANCGCNYFERYETDKVQSEIQQLQKSKCSQFEEKKVEINQND